MLEIIAGARDKVELAQRKNIHTQGGGEFFDPRNFTLAVLHHDKSEVHQRCVGVKTMLLGHNLCDALEDLLQATPPSVSLVGLLGDAIHREHEYIQSAIDDATGMVTTGKDMSVRTADDLDTRTMRDSNHLIRIRIQKGLPPIPKHDQEQIFSQLVNDPPEHRQIHIAHGSAKSGSDRAELAPEIASTGGLHL